MEYKKLSNGVDIPMLGFGTWKIPDEEAEIAVANAIEVGYRHIDTAAMYENEEGVGRGIVKSGVPREELFVTTKCRNADHGYKRAKEAFETSLKKLGLDYVDMYLIHWPKPENQETWRAIEELYLDGKVKAIGVCNFHVHHLEELMQTAKIIPMVNQIELHPKLTQHQVRSFMETVDIATESWSPLMRGKIFDHQELNELASKYQKSVAQIVLRWNLQKGFIVIPKTVTRSRMEENFAVFDFQLEEADLRRIDAMNEDLRTGSDPDDIYKK